MKIVQRHPVDGIRSWKLKLKFKKISKKIVSCKFCLAKYTNTEIPWTHEDDENQIDKNFFIIFIYLTSFRYGIILKNVDIPKKLENTCFHVNFRYPNLLKMGDQRILI